MPIYTTPEAIARRLEGYADPSSTGSAFDSSPVSPELITQVTDQVEARVTQVLSQRFVMPLKKTHTVVSSCVEKLIVCELLAQLYVGQDPSESGGYGSLMCKQGIDELEKLKSALLDDEQLLGGATLTIAGPVAKARSLPPLPEGETKRIQW